MARQIQAVRGMHDVLPQQSARWQALEGGIRRVLDSYGYAEIRMPLVEKTELFARSIGDVTDIVEKEMYSFDDRNGDNLSLRPEGTAGCVRACLEHGLLHNQMQRLWYQGPMFRHERPQKGRYRQFHQIGVEANGHAGPDNDVEIVLLTARIWRELGLTDLRLELNSLGTPDERAAHRQELLAFLRERREQLDADSRRRIDTNPLRVLDSKDPQTRAVIEDAPDLLAFLGTESNEHLAGVRAGLDAAGVGYRINPRLVRGLDYYSRTVFEWITDRLGAQGTVCAGGRYDGLVEQLGGRATPAIGFALGLERLLALIEQQADDDGARLADVYLVLAGTAAESAGMILAERIRDALPRLRVMNNCGGGSLKAQFKRADRSGARYALVVGERELADGVVGLKPLRGDGDQSTLAMDAVTDGLRTLFAGDSS